MDQGHGTVSTCKCPSQLMRWVFLLDWGAANLLSRTCLQILP